MIRKHLKVEPARWYYHCDREGILVWQDMPSGDHSLQWQMRNYFNGLELIRTPESEANIGIFNGPFSYTFVQDQLFPTYWNISGSKKSN